MEIKNIECPCCNSELVYTHSDAYQDLSEHVSDPNSEPSIKPAFQCPNIDCIASRGNVVWIENGEYFIIDRLSDISYSELTQSLDSRTTKGYAINSWNYHYELGKWETKLRTRKIKIGKYLIEIEPKTKGYKYPTKEEYRPRRFGWNFKFWKETGEGCHKHISPIHSMVLFYLQSFNSSYKSVCYDPDGNRSSIKSALEFAFGYRWGTKDERIFARIASFFIRKIYPTRVKELLSLAKNKNIKYY